jgi:hypothetical protein
MRFLAIIPTRSEYARKKERAMSGKVLDRTEWRPLQGIDKSELSEGRLGHRVPDSGFGCHCRSGGPESGPGDCDRDEQHAEDDAHTHNPHGLECPLWVRSCRGSSIWRCSPCAQKRILNNGSYRRITSNRSIVATWSPPDYAKRPLTEAPRRNSPIHSAT